MRKTLSCFFLLAVGAGPAMAQQSPHNKLNEHALNSGGVPDGPTVLTSPGFRLTVGALGDAADAVALAGTSFHMDVGFDAGYRAPGEVVGLHFVDHTTRQWDAELSAGTYNLYRDKLRTLPGRQCGQCLQTDLTGPQTKDSEPGHRGEGCFYLVTVENRRGKEGMGGAGSRRKRGEGTMCP